MLGIGGRNVRAVQLAGRRRLDPDACARAIDVDRRRGAVPVAVVATAGTTLTGAVDDIAALADVCARRGVWLHVDGAYGLPAAGVPSTRWRFAGLDRADSATVDAHKWLYVPKPCSVLLVRDPLSLEQAFAHQESYIPHLETEAPHAVDRTLEYSRPVRALKLWLAFAVHGAAGIRAAIERNLAQARLLAELLERHPRFELLVEPQLSAVCFRHVPPGVEDLDRYNRRLAHAIQVDGRIYLAGAEVDGRASLRACIVNYRTTDEDIRAILPVVEDVGARVRAG